MRDFISISLTSYTKGQISDNRTDAKEKNNSIASVYSLWTTFVKMPHPLRLPASDVIVNSIPHARKNSYQ